MSDLLLKDSTIFVAGHKGMVGGSVCGALRTAGYRNLLTADRQDLDLTDQAATIDFLQHKQPDAVVLAAARVGGIVANDTRPAEFIHENLMIQASVIHGAYLAGVKRLIFLGSSCIYPRMATQPIEETQLLTGALEKTNEAYAVAKIAGIKMCESYNRQYGTDFRALMPTNLYGPGDNFHPQHSHVIPGLLRRVHEAKLKDLPSVEVWGTGTVRREFLYVTDLADAVVHLLEKESLSSYVNPQMSHINVGTGQDVTIRGLVDAIVEVVEYEGEVEFDISKPDGTPRKQLDVSLIQSLGWSPKIGLQDGLSLTYQWYKESETKLRL